MDGWRRTLAKVCLSLGALGSCAPLGADADPPPRTDARPLSVRDGYVWKDAAGVVRLGEAVIAMGVMGDPGWSVSEPLATKLAPWLSAAKESWTFWNYALERGSPEDYASLPKAFVRLRGREKASPGGGGFDDAAGAFEEARLVRLEPIEGGWVRAWRPFFTDAASPWRVAQAADRSDAGRRRFLPAAVAALAAMRARPGPSDADRAAVKAIDPEAKVVATFRSRTEHDIQRWMLKETKELGVPWPKELAVVPLPPTTVEAQRLLLEAETKAAFLAAVAKVWSGDPELVEIVYYAARTVAGGESVSWTVTDLARLTAEWDEATYARHRATTKATVGR